MVLLRLKRLIAEREVLIGVVIFGVMGMIADIASDLGWSKISVLLRGLGILALVTLLVFNLWIRRRGRTLPVPLVFTEEENRTRARDLFAGFVQNANLESAIRVLEGVSQLQRGDLIIRLDRTKPRTSTDRDNWRAAWAELLREWSQEVDARLLGEPFVGERRCYHILPHVPLPLAFALGASVDLRRSVVLYHFQQGQCYPVLYLSNPRDLLMASGKTVDAPKSCPDNLATLPAADKLILHLVISDRHSPILDRHPDYHTAANASLVYRFSLNPSEDWLPYVQGLVQGTLPIVERYHQVDVCLVCPSVVAFALGMAFSRMPAITVCHWFEQQQQYLPVFSIAEVGRTHLPFD